MLLLVPYPKGLACGCSDRFTQCADRASLEGMVAIAKQNQETFGRRVNPYGTTGPAGVPKGVI